MSSTSQKIRFLLVIVCVLCFWSCSSPIPKPYAYARIDFPDHSYRLLERKDYPYSFMYSKYATAEEQLKYFSLNINYPKYNGTIYLSYKNIEGNLRDLSKDGYEFVYGHSSKADAIEANNYANPELKVWCVMYDIEGNVASPLQFIATDSIKHWIRGAVYLNAEMNRDSLNPIIDYIHDDVIKLVETLQWN